jgi:4'-phosphopantetheinyl transferase EntD
MTFFDDIRKTLARQSLYFTYATDFRTIDDLLPGERRAVVSACDSRQREFATGRWCARRLLGEMGVGGNEIGCGKDNEPVWPDGICGSITHTKDACCVITAFQNRCRSVGIDIEARARIISPSARSMFLNKDEEDWINGMQVISPDVYVTVFSIKECVFKLLHPLVKAAIPFSSVSVQPLENSNGFSCFVKGKSFDGISAKALPRSKHFRKIKKLISL